MSINEWWSVDGNIRVDSWVIGLGTSVSPWSSTNDLVIVFDWSTRVTLACVFTATTDTSTEHTLQDCAIVWSTRVTIWVSDDVNVDTVEFAWVWWSWVLKYVLQGVRLGWYPNQFYWQNFWDRSRPSVKILHDIVHKDRRPEKNFQRSFRFFRWVV